MKKIVPIFSIIVWLVFGLYFGIGGYLKIDNDETISEIDQSKSSSNDTIVVARYNAAKQSMIEEIVEETSALFPWTRKVPLFFAFLITTSAFGLLGAVTNIIWKISANKYKVEDVKYLSVPILGLLNGLFILGLVKLIPNILLTESKGIRPESLLFLSLFGGFYSIKFYDYLYRVINHKILKDSDK